MTRTDLETTGPAPDVRMGITSSTLDPGGAPCVPEPRARRTLCVSRTTLVFVGVLGWLIYAAPWPVVTLALASLLIPLLLAIVADAIAKPWF